MYLHSSNLLILAIEDLVVLYRHYIVLKQFIKEIKIKIKKKKHNLKTNNFLQQHKFNRIVSHIIHISLILVRLWMALGKCNSS